MDDALNWFNTNDILLNTTKKKTVLFTHKKCDEDYESVYKMLGIYVESTLLENSAR